MEKSLNFHTHVQKDRDEENSGSETVVGSNQGCMYRSLGSGFIWLLQQEWICTWTAMIIRRRRTPLTEGVNIFTSMAMTIRIDSR